MEAGILLWSGGGVPVDDGLDFLRRSPQCPGSDFFYDITLC